MGRPRGRRRSQRGRKRRAENKESAKRKREPGTYLSFWPRFSAGTTPKFSLTNRSFTDRWCWDRSVIELPEFPSTQTHLSPQLLTIKKIRSTSARCEELCGFQRPVRRTYS